jgi:DNA repair protein RadC
MEDNVKHLTIKALAEDDRPREKLLNLGRQSLSDAELIAIILGSGSKHETAVQLAQRMLSDHRHSINALAKLSLNDLKKYKGVGEAKAVNIAAAFEIGRRRTETETADRVKITSSEMAYRIIQKRLSDLPHEEFWVLILNRANQVVKEECISKGGLASTIVDARIICKAAIENNASGIILSHNHPSGQIQPSMEDKNITKRLKEALRLFDINLFDHIIVGDQKYFSFNDEGLI